MPKQNPPKGKAKPITKGMPKPVKKAPKPVNRYEDGSRVSPKPPSNKGAYKPMSIRRGKKGAAKIATK